MKGKSVQYHCQTSLKWTGEKKGKLNCEDKPDVNVCCPSGL